GSPGGGPGYLLVAGPPTFPPRGEGGGGPPPRHFSKRWSRRHLAPPWSGNPDIGAGADTAGYGCPAATSVARTRTRIGFLVTGANGTAAGFGYPGAGADIGSRRWSRGEPILRNAASRVAWRPHSRTANRSGRPRRTP